MLTAKARMVEADERLLSAHCVEWLRKHQLCATRDRETLFSHFTEEKLEPRGHLRTGRTRIPTQAGLHCCLPLTCSPGCYSGDAEGKIRGRKSHV